MESSPGARDQVEAHLALGATRWEAARPLVQQAVRTGLIPTINAMMVVGIVSLPGMMTGQILAGADPVQAVKYQIVIMFLLASAAALGTVSVVLLSYSAAFQRAPPVPEHAPCRAPNDLGRPTLTLARPRVHSGSCWPRVSGAKHSSTRPTKKRPAMATTA